MLKSISGEIHTPLFPGELTDALRSVVAPTYIYDITGLSRDLVSWQKLIDTFAPASPSQPVRLKPTVFAPANPRRELLRIFADHGFGITVIRNQDRQSARSVGFQDRRIIVSGFGHSKDELEKLRSSSCQVNLASEPEVLNWCRSSNSRPVGIRIDCGRTGQRKDWPFDKLGIPENRLRRLLVETSLQVAGYHYYIGTNESDCSTHLKGLSRCVRAVRMARSDEQMETFYINAGGGFPLDRTVLHGFLARAENMLSKCGFDIPIDFFLEMGRSILGPHAVFAAPIRSCFQKRGIFYLSLDASISQFPRPSRYGFHPSFPPFSEDGKHNIAILDSNGRVVSQSSHTAGRKRVVLAGNSHYSRDILGTANVDSRSSLRYIEGGLVVFGDAGAYCESMAENWLSDGRVGVLFL